MNREILFRGKRVDNGEWVVGLLCYDSSGHPKNIEQCGFNKPYEGTFVVIPETVGQFTGITDKNGVKIFEGDIFKIDEEQEIYEVRFEYGCFLAFYNGEQFGFIEELRNCFLEVVGNIHDNPELLK